MSTIFSNGPSKDFVINPFQKLLYTSKQAFLAAPYFTRSDEIVEAANKDVQILLLIGLNIATKPEAISKVIGFPNVSIRYFTDKFHSKVYIFDKEALVGSSNLTGGGMFANREAVVWIDKEDSLDELRSLFAELWESASVLTPEKLKKFDETYKEISKKRFDGRKDIEGRLDKSTPVNIDVRSTKVDKKRLFFEKLYRQLYEEYIPAFSEVTQTLSENNLRRNDFDHIGVENEINRFLNWIRLEYTVGDSWKSQELLSLDSRIKKILHYGSEWLETKRTHCVNEYFNFLQNVSSVFGSPKSIESASDEDLLEGLMSIHAFSEQLRFVKGGKSELPQHFLKINDSDVSKIKSTIIYLLYGEGDFVERLHDILYRPDMKLKLFGKFCALELYGTIKPAECPPMNGRMAKALRFLGFDVSGTG